jgi:exopolyphosphatase/guanosine-5'-triphosphate,3'-diphosphate pyrophosphatase
VQLLALRLAVLFHHARAAIDLPRIHLKVARRISLDVSPRWLAAHPLTAHLLDKEREEWAELGYRWKSLGN